MLEIEILPAVLAGLIAGAVMEGPVYLQKALGLPVKQNIFRTWGNLFGLRGAGGYLVGSCSTRCSLRSSRCCTRSSSG